MSMNIANIVVLKVLAFKLFFGQYHGSGSIRII